ncbi:O-antigen ligase family protein [Chitiniphilus shinanonensis]|uniref:O-antigen ligase family protein n=1 Tax=Chitiniphilus shinanonensis TaxID=553088 RepID=UPI0030327DD4
MKLLNRAYLPYLAELALAMFLLGLFFPIRAAQSIGFGLALLTAILALVSKPRANRPGVWILACLSLLAAGIWGSANATIPEDSWRHFWSYQTIGKGIVCALALSLVGISERQFGRILFLLAILLFARNVQMLIFGYHHPVFLGGIYIIDPTIHIRYRNQADHIIVLLPFLLAWLLNTRTRKHAYLAMGACLVEAILLASTGWRGAFLGFVAAVTAVLVFYRAWGPLLAMAGSILLLPLFALLSKGNLIASALSRGTNDNSRISLIWKPVLNMIGEQPYTGYGFGQRRFIEVFQQYAAHHPNSLIPPDAHNMVLNFAMAAGLPGALAFLLILVTALFLCARGWKQCLARNHNAMLAGCFAAWLGTYGLLGLTDQPHYNLLAALAVLTSVSLAKRSDAET